LNEHLRCLQLWFIKWIVGKMDPTNGQHITWVVIAVLYGPFL